MRMLQGAGIAFLLIGLFLLPVDTNPAWPKYWMIRPLIVVPFAGAVGGFFYYKLDHLRVQGGWMRFWAAVLSFFIYVFGLWVGTILGLDGTLWN
ncbi:potassium transporter KefB [Flavobacterium sp. MAH-1]|uniref:Potassium transporter KefB n=1 Tax=Flavobacterium agri TaxID=2743471 RepID=A0A7Y8Y3W2_9FLAO|nr:potassium transporter KefB [Flavobacterium agri]NYA72129.1 potassium transporter KefB [Flavobacterium agri]